MLVIEEVRKVLRNFCITQLPYFDALVSWTWEERLIIPSECMNIAVVSCESLYTSERLDVPNSNGMIKRATKQEAIVV